MKFSFSTLLLGLGIGILLIVYSLYYDVINDDNIEELEQLVIHKLYNSTVISVWRNITVDEEVWPTHILQPSYINETKPNLLLLHGYGATSAITWRVTIPGLTSKFNVYAIDMPGFGRTPAPPSLLSIQDPKEAHMKYCSFYRNTIESFQLSSPPFLVAHSFGGFVMTQCLAEYPQLVSGAILIAVPGFFSSNGPWGWVCASYFSFGLPQYPIQLLGDWMHYIYDLLMLINDVDIDYVYVRYWHLVHMSKDMIPDAIVRKFILHHGIYSMGVGISFLPLIKLTHKFDENSTPLPVAIVFGEKDFISPPQQGLCRLRSTLSHTLQGHLITEVSGIKTYVIDGANHVAYTHNGGKDFLQVCPLLYILSLAYLLPQVFDEIYSSLDEIHSSYRTPHPSLPLSRLSECLEKEYTAWSRYPVVPSYFLSKYFSDQMYNKIREIVASCAESSTSLDPSPSTPLPLSDLDQKNSEL